MKRLNYITIISYLSSKIYLVKTTNVRLLRLKYVVEARVQRQQNFYYNILEYQDYTFRGRRAKNCFLDFLYLFIAFLDKVANYIERTPQLIISKNRLLCSEQDYVLTSLKKRRVEKRFRITSQYRIPYNYIIL